MIIHMDIIMDYSLKTFYKMFFFCILRELYQPEERIVEATDKLGTTMFLIICWRVDWLFPTFSS